MFHFLLPISFEKACHGPFEKVGFLNRDHERHNYVILNTRGNCDCGDLEQWKKSGTCSKHRTIDGDEENPENYLDEKLRTILTDIIFKASLTSLKQQLTNNLQNSSIIIQFFKIRRWL